MQALEGNWEAFNSLQKHHQALSEEYREELDGLRAELDAVRIEHAYVKGEHDRSRQIILLGAAVEALAWCVNEYVFQLPPTQRPGAQSSPVTDPEEQVNTAAEKQSFNLLTLRQIDWRYRMNALKAEERRCWGNVKAQLMRDNLDMPALLPVNTELRDKRLECAHGSKKQRKKVTKRDLESWAQKLLSSKPTVLASVRQAIDLLSFVASD
ncbi:g1541 [Coccomyxa elongata]